MNQQKRKERARRKAAHNLKMRNGNNAKAQFLVHSNSRGDIFLMDSKTGKTVAVENKKTGDVE
jgi:hypothetical protein